jgi:hypothetical protein
MHVRHASLPRQGEDLTITLSNGEQITADPLIGNPEYR